jgi:hypothetical protein
LFKVVCPYEGSRLVRARSFVAKTLTSKNKDSISVEIVSQLAFWTAIQDYAKTFSKASDRAAAEKTLVKDVSEQYKTYSARRLATKDGEALKKILANKSDSAAYAKKIEKLSNSIIVVALSRKCLCNAFLRSQYKPNAPQTEKDLQWTQGAIILGSMMNSCKSIPAATELCKAYKVTGKDLSCAVLPDEKGCTPIYEKLYADMIAPIKHKMSTGESQGVKERKITVEEPTWLKQIQLEQAKDKPKTITPPVQPQIQKVEPPKTIEPPKPVEAPKTVEPAKPVEAPKQQPVSPPKPVEPAKPVIVQPPVKPEPAKPKIAPLIVPKVPKKTKIETPQPTQVKGSASNGSGSTGSGSTGSGSPPTQPVQPTPQQPALKVPTGPTQFVGQKKKINIFNQK